MITLFNRWELIESWTWFSNEHFFNCWIQKNKIRLEMTIYNSFNTSKLNRTYVFGRRELEHFGKQAFRKLELAHFG